MCGLDTWQRSGFCSMGTIEQFRDLELAVARALTKLLRSYKERLAAQNRAYGPPEI
jgi:hypothetical protein